MSYIRQNDFPIVLQIGNHLGIGKKLSNVSEYRVSVLRRFIYGDIRVIFSRLMFAAVLLLSVFGTAETSAVPVGTGTGTGSAMLLVHSRGVSCVESTDANQLDKPPHSPLPPAGLLMSIGACIWDMGVTAPAEHSCEGREGAPQ